MAVLEHASVTLTCVFTGNPPPMITWEREGPEDLPVVTRREITMRNEIVTMNNMVRANIYSSVTVLCHACLCMSVHYLSH